jgi:holo-[acyl-carrier protein] synthase
MHEQMQGLCDRPGMWIIRAMIVGLGLDLVEVDSIAAAMRRDDECAFAWLTEREIEQLGPRAAKPDVIAGRVAAKEAVAKALGTGFAGDVAWQDVEVLAGAEGASTVTLSGGAADAAAALGAVRVLVSITHTARNAAACAVALSKLPGAE